MLAVDDGPPVLPRRRPAVSRRAVGAACFLGALAGCGGRSADLPGRQPLVVGALRLLDPGRRARGLPRHSRSTRAALRDAAGLPGIHLAGRDEGRLLQVHRRRRSRGARRLRRRGRVRARVRRRVDNRARHARARARLPLADGLPAGGPRRGGGRRAVVRGGVLRAAETDGGLGDAGQLHRGARRRLRARRLAGRLPARRLRPRAVPQSLRRPPPRRRRRRHGRGVREPLRQEPRRRLGRRAGRGSPRNTCIWQCSGPPIVLNGQPFDTAGVCGVDTTRPFSLAAEATYCVHRERRHRDAASAPAAPSPRPATPSSLTPRRWPSITCRRGATSS